MRKNKVAKNVKEFLLDLIFMTVGSVIYAVGLNGFTAPNNIAPGGVSGIAIVLNYLFGTPVGTVILLINVPIIIWAIIEIGYKLVTKTMLAVVLNAACIDIVALFMPVYHGDPLIITLIGGVCEGVGLYARCHDRRHGHDRASAQSSPAPSFHGQADACRRRLRRAVFRHRI
mgnify:CR=1 FL=1